MMGCCGENSTFLLSYPYFKAGGEAIRNSHTKYVHTYHKGRLTCSKGQGENVRECDLELWAQVLILTHS